jgi:hypothetical protein
VFTTKWLRNVIAAIRVMICIIFGILIAEKDALRVKALRAIDFQDS